MIFKVNSFFHDKFCMTIKLLYVLNIHVLSVVVMIISSLHTAKQIKCQKALTSMHLHLNQSPLKRLKPHSNPEPLSSQTNTQPFGQTGQIIELCSEYLSVR